MTTERRRLRNFDPARKTGAASRRRAEGSSLAPAKAAAGFALGFGFCVLAIAPAPLAAQESPRFEEAVKLFLAGDWKGCQLAFGHAAQEAQRAGLAARAAYGAACCAAQRNDLDGGFLSLAHALDNGFIDLERALSDPRLAALQADPRWVVFATTLRERQQAHQKTLDPDLLRLYLEQQGEPGVADRSLTATTPGASGAEAAQTRAAEQALARRKEVWGLVEQGRVRQADDAFHAAAILVRSDQLVEVVRAAELARQALTLNPDLLPAKPLVAQAIDRGLMFAGKPQLYGTQLIEDRGRWKVYDVDPAVSDAERAAWGLPPLAEAQARAAELNRTAPEKPAAPALPPS